MKILGTCKDCKFYRIKDRFCLNGIVTNGLLLTFNPEFGCVHWESSKEPRENYPSKSDSGLVIDTLKRENDCAAAEIVRLSKMIVELGYDPTVKLKEITK